MTASASIATPTMKIPFLGDQVERDMRRFVQKATKLTVAELVDRVLVEERLLPKKNGPRRRKYTVTLQFFDPSEYTETYGVEVEDVLRGLATNFVPMLEKEIKAELKRSKKQEKAQAADIGRGHAARMAEAQNEAEEQEAETLRHDTAEDVEDGDADDLKRAAQRNQNHDYDASDAGSEHGDLETDFEATFANATSQSKPSQEEPASNSESEDEAQPEATKSSTRRERLETLEHQCTVDTTFIHSVTFDKERGAFCKLELEVIQRCILC